MKTYGQSPGGILGSLLNPLVSAGQSAIGEQVGAAKQQAMEAAKEYLPVTAASFAFLMIAASVASDSLSSLLQPKVRNTIGLVIMAGGAYLIYDWYSKQPKA